MHQSVPPPELNAGGGTFTRGTPTMWPYGYDLPPEWEAPLNRLWAWVKRTVIYVRGWVHFQLWGRRYARLTIEAFERQLAADYSA